MKEQKEKRRPSLEDLKQMPRDGLDLELMYIAEAAKSAGLQDVEAQAVAMLEEGSISANDVVGLREQLQGVAVSTSK